MKLKFLLAIGLFISLNSNAQNYQPFPTEDGAYWVYLEFDNHISPYKQRYIYHQYMLRGDSVINNKTYHKVVVRSSIDTLTSTMVQDTRGVTHSYHNRVANQRDSLMFLYRESNKEIYCVLNIPQNISGAEFLLYDFSKVGSHDSVKAIGTYYIMSIDSVLIGGNYHYKYGWGQNHWNNVIEGVGAKQQLFPHYLNGENWGWLVCFNNGNGGTYSDTNTQCMYIHPYGTPASVESIKERTELTAAPNPFTNTVIISSPTEVNISVYNTVGKKVYSQNNVKNTSIETDSWGMGMYYLVSQDIITGAVQTKKIIKR